MSDLPKTYDPDALELKWYPFWSERGYFAAPVEPGVPRFCITIPPPNVTGELHMGHALQHAMHDLLVRRKRMQGFNTLCLPGTDHASIGTSVKIEEALKREGKSRWELGREAYTERAWDWTRRYGGTILQQLRALGCSYDWSRTRFTLDDGYYRAVLTAFVHCYDRGWIYRGKRVMNWCPTCQTVVSDLEVQHRDLNANLWHIRYPRADGQGSVTVATTRPETMLGDTAVAVRPGDARYAAQVGQQFLLPIIGREVPMVADRYVEAEFGTGVVKVTPAHDPNDWEIGQRHDLPAIEVIGPDGKMTEAAGRFAGLDRLEARRRVLEELAREGLLEKTDPYSHAVGHHDRCGTTLEPLLSRQWFMRMGELAAPALRAIREGRVRFTPERFRPMTEEWLVNIRDWCLSRQLWWGQRIPVYTCACGHELATVDPPERCAACGATTLEQDPDVLDTWFSSALWPFATLGWPEQTEDLVYFYPTDLMITGRDILYLWIARMVMMGEEFMGKEPFRDVVIHATVQSEEGRRMSKSLGTGVDPLQLIARYGADATRFGLTSLVTDTQDVRFKIEWESGGKQAAGTEDELARAEQVEQMRNFCTKLWNVTRFALMNLGEGFTPAGALADTPPPHWPLAVRRAGGLELADRWILSRLAATVAAVNEAVDRYALGQASWLLYHFVWDDLADWYLELAKPRLRQPGPGIDVREPLLAVLETTLRLAHPFLPFLTEELWQALPGAASPERPSLMISPYPESLPELLDPEAETAMERVIEIARALRNLRAGLQVPPAQEIEVAVAGEPLANQERDYVAQASRVRFIAAEAPPPFVRASAAGREFLVGLTGMVDVDAERTRTEKRLVELKRDVERRQAKLGNPQFLERAPGEIIAKERQIVADLLEELGLLEERLRLFGGI